MLGCPSGKVDAKEGIGIQVMKGDIEVGGKVTF
jgi:hypothetical protein